MAAAATCCDEFPWKQRWHHSAATFKSQDRNVCSKLNHINHRTRHSAGERSQVNANLLVAAQHTDSRVKPALRYSDFPLSNCFPIPCKKYLCTWQQLHNAAELTKYIACCISQQKYGNLLSKAWMNNLVTVSVWQQWWWFDHWYIT